MLLPILKAEESKTGGRKRNRTHSLPPPEAGVTDYSFRRQDEAKADCHVSLAKIVATLLLFALSDLCPFNSFPD